MVGAGDPDRRELPNDNSWCAASCTRHEAEISARGNYAPGGDSYPLGCSAPHRVHTPFARPGEDQIEEDEAK